MVGAVQVCSQFAVVGRAQAQQPVTRGIARLAQQQVDQTIVRAVAVVMVVTLVEPQQLVHNMTIRGGAEAVAEHLALGIDPHQALQGRQSGLQFREDVRQLRRAWRRTVRLDNVVGHLRLERHAQGHVIGQFGAGVKAVLVLVGLGVAVLVDQLPEQQAEQQQDQQGQRAFQRTA
ncbi:hypothetical protein D3C76_714040 [compost metagenome]